MFYTESITVGRKVSLLRSIWNKIVETFEQIGYARSAAELARLGHYELARNLILHASELKKHK